MHAAVVRPQRGGTAPQVPIQLLRRLGILPRLLRAIAAVQHKAADHPDLPGLSLLQELPAGDIVRRDAAVRPHLDDAIGVSGRLDHRLALQDRVADRLFHVHVGAGLDGVDHRQRDASGPAWPRWRSRASPSPASRDSPRRAWAYRSPTSPPPPRTCRAGGGPRPPAPRSCTGPRRPPPAGYSFPTSRSRSGPCDRSCPAGPWRRRESPRPVPWQSSFSETSGGRWT